MFLFHFGAKILSGMAGFYVSPARGLVPKPVSGFFRLAVVGSA
jgi:hypothetical protein